MTMEATDPKNWQERRLGRTILTTYRATLDIDEHTDAAETPGAGRPPPAAAAPPAPPPQHSNFVIFVICHICYLSW